ncbi:MAG: MBL fold metallo-hydrolase [Spirochaetales bacterium]|uniref:MBL fold metallo-hydrolase n=1 Tax=Candidatus Thalassospirochaeta sargassi TaxID=3119039 RepID=A0AAJ1IJG0_9SPIO|nr:MBL fold metallo-hydrolase [Spirochaetales bacterium]
MTEGLSAGGLGLTWLGQAGFLVECGKTRLIIDAYLSDSLYDKYKDKKFPHKRMIPVPFAPTQLTDIDLVFCTHGHTDHMDPGTLPHLAAANPGGRFVVPASEKAKAVERGVPADRLIGLDAEGSLFDNAKSGIVVRAIASAHEELATDSEGRSLYLGYVVDICGQRLYHSGDCIPYTGLAEALKKLHIDVALLPVNGRDDYRKSNGVPGNFTVAEAAELCVNSGIKTIIPHHFGMFDFNTESPEIIDGVLSESGLNYMIPEVGKSLIVDNE